MSAPPRAAHRLSDIFRKALIVASLVCAMLLLHQFAPPVGDFDPRGLLALGFLILAAYTVGELAEVVRIPHITGYLLAGIVFGPSLADVLSEVLPETYRLPPLDEGVVSERVLHQLGLIDSLALALIALTAGGELKLDELRQSFRHVLASTWGMVAAVVPLVTLYAVVINAAAPAAMPMFAGLEPRVMLSIAVVLSVLAAATSPAVAIAVINSTGAKGPVATTVLTGVVVGEITVVLLFSGASSIVIGLTDTKGSISVTQALANVGMSIAIGALVGTGISLYLRYVGTEILLFLVGIIYTTSFVLFKLDGEIAVAFIAAGLVVGNFSSLGGTLIREVERLSRPTYVVFFALAGAKLDLATLWTMLLPAVGLFVVRGVGVYFGARGGARLARAPLVVQEYAWMGFVSQAGLAIALAIQARDVLPEEIGPSVFSLVIAVISIAEMVGPLALQLGLSRAGEIGGSLAASEGALPPQSAPTRSEPGSWQAGASEDPWGSPSPTGSEALDQAIAQLEIDLRAALRACVDVPVEERLLDISQQSRQLRREWLRIVRRASTWQGEPEAFASVLREDVGEIAARWQKIAIHPSPVLAMAIHPHGLVETLDAKAAALPRQITAGVVASVLAPRPEPTLRKAQRALSRLRGRVLPHRRRVDLMELGRYRLSGELPGQLEELAAVTVRADMHVASCVAALFRNIAEDFEAAARLAETKHSLEEVRVSLEASRARVDLLFRSFASDIEAIGRDVPETAALAVGRCMRAIRTDAATVGTIELSSARRRYGRVFHERNRGVTAITEGLHSGRELVAARRAQAALEIELLALESRERAIVRGRAGELERHLRGRGPRQLSRISAALEEWLAKASALLDPTQTAGALSRQLRRESEPLVHKIREARASVESLLSELTSERWVRDLTTALSEQTHELSESYTLPSEPIRAPELPAPGTSVSGPRRALLPAPPPTTEIALREIVGGFVENRVTRELLDTTDDLGRRVREMAAALEEVERVTSFNVELSCAELDVLDEGAPLAPETAEIIRAMVVGAVGRSQHRLARLTELADLVTDHAGQRIHDAVLAQFGALRAMLLGFAPGELRALRMRDGRFGALARRASIWSGFLPGLWERASAIAKGALGEERIEALRARLGLPQRAEQRDSREAFAPPTPQVDVPIVYRRLFSDLPLDTADMLAGRQLEIDRIRAALTHRGPLRAAAVISVDLQSASALASASVRGDFEGVLRLDARAPADDRVVDAWLARAASLDDYAIIIEGLHWLFERKPAGSSPIERLFDGMLADRGRNAWLLVVDSAVWAHLAQATAAGDIAGTIVDLGALDEASLEREVLARHAMSGYSVEFDADEDLGWQIENFLSRGQDKDRRIRRAWFRTLHAASNGILQDALRLWMASILEVDDEKERVRIGAVPRPPLTRIARLPEETLLTLFETARQGWTSPEQHSRLFRTSAQSASAHLASLTQLGLLLPEGGVLRIAPHLRGTVHRALSQRRWV